MRGVSFLVEDGSDSLDFDDFYMFLLGGFPSALLGKLVVTLLTADLSL